MLIDFFFCARRYKVPVSLGELLDLISALEKLETPMSLEDFYFLSRLIWVKNESHYDRYDQAFLEYFEGVSQVDLTQAIPEEWLKKNLVRLLSEEDKNKLQALGSLEKLLEEFKERLKEQQKRHEGGSKWVGTGGTSPFGAYGYHPEGIRVGGESVHRKAVKVWEKRTFKDLDTEGQLTNRSMQLALRNLRAWARTGQATELDLEQSIRNTANNAGWLDLSWRPERLNHTKVLLLFDIGGSMDDYIHECEQLFQAARSEFKHLEFYYFHNCVYEHVWRHNERRFDTKLSTYDLIQTYGADYKLLFVGDATMGPYEIAFPGGSVEHWNKEAGSVWMQRVLNHFSAAAWLNPQPQHLWSYYPSIAMIAEIMEQRMFPLTVDGILQATQVLTES